MKLISTIFLCCAALCAQAQEGSQLPLSYPVENTGAAFAKPKMPEASKLPVIEDLPLVYGESARELPWR